MKKINFVKVLSPSQQRSFLLWYDISLGLFVLVSIGVIVCQIMQLYTCITVYYEYNRSLALQASNHAINAERNELIQRKTVTQKRLELVQLGGKGKSIVPILSLYNNALSKKLLLSSLSLHKTKGICTVQCAKTSDSTHFMHKLETYPLFKSIQLSQIKIVDHGKQASLPALPRVEATIVAIF